MLWINFLHLYQPVNADAHVIKEATEKSYMRIIRALEEHPNSKFTLNIQGGLFLRWEELGYQNLIMRIGKMFKKGQIELTSTCAFHPLAPLIPIEEVKKQIEENEIILKKKFGNDFCCKGFFLPEMAYGVEVARLIKEKGYEWLILDEITHSGTVGKIKHHQVYRDKNSDLKIVFRMRGLSQNFVPDILSQEGRLKKYKSSDDFYITATDAEIYGLRHIDHTGEFEKFLSSSDLKTDTISGFIGSCSIEEAKLVASNWESTEEELKNKLPYALWHHPKNNIQKKLWELANLAYKVINENQDDENYYWARWHLVRGFASCTFWWASGRDFKLFGNISWSPDEIERGVNEFIRGVRALQKENTRKSKMKAERLYIKVKQLVWNKHWNYIWKK